MIYCCFRIFKVTVLVDVKEIHEPSVLSLLPGSGISLEGMMLKLKLQYFGHLMRRVDSLEKTLILGGIGDRRKRDDRVWDGWMASLTRWTWVWVNSGSWWWTGRPGVLQFMGSQRVGHDWVTELNWTEKKFMNHLYCLYDLEVGNMLLKERFSW